MNFLTTIGYHDGFFEVEVVVYQNSNARDEAVKIGNSNDLNLAILSEDKLTIGKNDKKIIITKQDDHLYQFKVCRLTEDEIQNQNHIVSPEDYVNISWDEALHYLDENYAFTFPYSLEGYYYAIYENEVKFSS